MLYKIFLLRDTIDGDSMYYINCFFIYSFMGFVMESIISLIKKKKIGSGILYGPWTPVYGIGSVLILLISNFLFRILKLETWMEVLIMLFVMMIILTFIEWLGGILIEKFFHVTFWDYRKFKFNIGKYIALEISFVWVIGSLLVLYIIQPLLDRFIFFIPNYVTYLLILLMIIDFMTVFIKKKTHK